MKAAAPERSRFAIDSDVAALRPPSTNNIQLLAAGAPSGSLFIMADMLSKKLSVSKTIQKKSRVASSPRTSSDKLATAVSADANEDTDVREGPGASLDDFSAEYEVKHPTGEKMRDKVRNLLRDAVFKKDENLVDSIDEAFVVACAIENAMFVKYDGAGAAYKSKYRNISFNLKDPKNRKLRMAVLHKHIPPSELMDLSNDDLANDELKKTREEMHEKMTRDAMPYNKQEASTDMFRCGKCKQRKCTYFQMQTRSADEPLTTFVSCVNCGNRWRF